MSNPLLPYFQIGTGRPLIVIPGLVGRRGVPDRLSRRMQHQEVAQLSQSRAVWSIDRRHGLASDTLVRDIARDYAATIANLFNDPVDIVGVSTGGAIALQLAVDVPALVNRLVIVSSAYRLSDSGRATQLEIADRLRRGHSRRAAALFIANTGATRIQRSLLGAAGALAPRIVVGHNDPDLLATLNAEDAFNLGDRIGMIAAPTLIAGGENDRFYGAELFAETAERIPGSRLRIYPRAGHISTHGNRRLVRDILAFLGDHDADTRPNGPASG